MVDVFRAIPEYKLITIEVIDESKLPDLDNLTPGDNLISDFSMPSIKKAFVGYVKGPGTPVPVDIEVNRLHVEYDENYPSPEVLEKMSPNEQYMAMKRANNILHRDMLTKVIRKCDIDTADLLASGNNGREILTALGWISSIAAFPDADSLADTNDEDDEGEV